MRIGVFGATGAVGREIIQVLGDRKFPVTELKLYSSPRSAGTTI
jgi:aspartate-semialdehyde dehydrogenase